MTNVFAKMNEEVFRRCRENSWTDDRGSKFTMKFDPASVGYVKENGPRWSTPYTPMSNEDWDEAMTTPIS